jgi:hypothetical protein
MQKRTVPIVVELPGVQHSAEDRYAAPMAVTIERRLVPSD